jgi:hypothetical protein
MRAPKRRRGFGSSEATHLTQAKQLVSSAYNDLERLPPTCEGGVQVAARAYGSVREARAHLDAIETRTLRADNDDLFGMLNIADKAAWDALRFFSTTCKAPHREAAERPTTSRAKAYDILHPPKQKGRRQ